LLRAGRSRVRTSPPRLTTLTAYIKKVEGKVFPVHVTKAYRGSRRIAPLILHLGARWRSVVSFTSRPLCHRERTPLPIEFKAGWATEAVWTFWRRQIPLDPAAIRALDRPAEMPSHYTNRAIPASVRALFDILIGSRQLSHTTQHCVSY